MATARRLDASLQLTPYFHCTSRCVRGSYLCGVDKTTGKDYTHRRIWLRQRLLQLADVFSIKLLAFAIMENHFHVVFHVDISTANTWSDKEVIERWHRLFKGTPTSRHFLLHPETLDESEKRSLTDSIQCWRKSLHDIGWFMRCLKEPLARLANKEDGCKGRFWEGRYYSQALLDTKAVVACMTYVDLNPTRANMCTMPEDDSFTSLHFRVKATKLNKNIALPSGIVDFKPLPKNRTSLNFPLCVQEYLELVDATARQRRPDKTGVLSNFARPILERIGICSTSWQTLESRFTNRFHVLVGSSKSIKAACQSLGQNSAWGQAACHELFGEYPI